MRAEEGSEMSPSAGPRREIVLAPPGSGKTTKLSETIYKELETLSRSEELDIHEAANNILCLTYTRRAACNMREKIRKRFKRGRKRYPTNLDDQIGTLHAHCLKILRSNEKLSDESNILDPESPLAEAIKRKLNKEIEPDKRKNRPSFSAIQGLSLRLRLNSELPEIGRKMGSLKGIRKELLKKAKKYLEIKGKKGVEDFGDILINYYIYFIAHEEATAPKYGLVLVDEAQDLNRFQLEIIRTLVTNDGKIIYYADPAQSIYSFQGADIKDLKELYDSIPESGRAVLTSNYRSVAPIVQFINAYRKIRLEELDSCFGIKPQEPKSREVPMPGWLKIMYSTSLLQERREITKYIESLPPKETCAILARDNDSVDEMVSYLTKKKRFYVYNPSNDVHWNFVKALESHLRVCSDPGNRDNWLKLVNTLKPAHSNLVNQSEMESLGIYPSDLIFYPYGGSKYNMLSAISDGQDTELTILIYGIVKKEQIIVSDCGRTIKKYRCSRDEFRKLLDSIPENQLIMSVSQDEASEIIRDFQVSADKIKKGIYYQMPYFARPGIRKIQSWLNERYLPIFRTQMRTMDEIEIEIKEAPDNQDRLDIRYTWRIFDWMRSAMKKLEDLGLVAPPKFGMWDTVLDILGNKMKEWIKEEIVSEEKRAKPDRRSEAKWKMDYIDRLCRALSELDRGEVVTATEMPLRKVSVMTVHQSKGMEFDNVIMYKAIEAKYKDDSDEERRILNVGLTRAKKRIAISYSDTWKLNTEDVEGHGTAAASGKLLKKKKRPFPKTKIDEDAERRLRLPVKILSPFPEPVSKEKVEEVKNDREKEVKEKGKAAEQVGKDKPLSRENSPIKGRKIRPHTDKSAHTIMSEMLREISGKAENLKMEKGRYIAAGEVQISGQTYTVTGAMSKSLDGKIVNASLTILP